MPDRTKLLVHFRRISNLFGKAIRNGPEDSLEGKYALEQPTFIHHICAFYLVGCLAYLEGEDGSYSWNRPGASSSDFDAFVAGRPNYVTAGVCKARMNALAQVRNAVAHNDGDLSKNSNQQSMEMVAAANLPGVTIQGTIVTLEDSFLEFVRLSAYAVRNYHGES